MKENLSSKKSDLGLVSQAETIRKLNETKQYTLMATALLEKVLTDSNLTSAAAKLWEYLYTKAIMSENLSVRIKYKDLAEIFDRSERSMKRYVDNLKNNGYLHVESNFHYHGQRANTFFLRIPDAILKSLEQSKDRTKKKAVDKIVTPDHDTNVTPKNNIKKDILLNNNNTVDHHAKSNVLHGTMPQHNELQTEIDIESEKDNLDLLQNNINQFEKNLSEGNKELTRLKDRASMYNQIRKNAELEASLYLARIARERLRKKIEDKKSQSEITNKIT